jgi:hypothetical protein
MDKKGFWHPDNLGEAIQLIAEKLEDPEFIARAERARAEMGPFEIPDSEPDPEDEEKPKLASPTQSYPVTYRTIEEMVKNAPEPTAEAKAENLRQALEALGVPEPEPDAPDDERAE